MSDLIQAFDTHMPNYIEIVRKYPDYTFEKVEIDPDKYPIITEHREKLNKLFTGRYFDEAINQETVAKWFYKLQHVTDSIVERYENAFRLYREYVDNNTEVLDKSVTKTEYSNSTEYFNKSGNPTGALFKDSTPESMIDRLINSVSSNKGKDESVSTVTSDNQMDVIGQVNDNINKFIDLENAFVSEYSNLFMKIYY